MAKRKSFTHLNRFYVLRTQLLRYIRAKHTIRRHLGYKYIPIHICGPTQHNGMTCKPWCSVQSVLNLIVRVMLGKSHLHFLKGIPFIEFLSYSLFAFLRVILHPCGSFLAYQALNFQRNNLAHIQGSSRIMDFICLYNTLGTRVKLFSHTFVFLIFF